MSFPNFTQMFAPQETVSGPLQGYTIGVKDLFDVKGYRTRAGSLTRDALPPAEQDSDAVARLRTAGATLVGHTNMTEFAYSGLGLNPHYGTPCTPLIDGAIAGGSTSGGAAALAEGTIDIALGTDTGGSARIPAAFCGLVGFKPTAANISRRGVVPLSHSLDSVGILGRSVQDVEKIYTILSVRSKTRPDISTPKLLIPKSFGMSDLDPQIETAFWNSVAVLERSGYVIEQADPDFLQDYAQLPIWHFSAVESRFHHAKAYETARKKIDPRVAARMDRADDVSGIDYLATLMLRQKLIHCASIQLQNTVILLPTVAILPPQLSTFEDPQAFDRLNLLALRNTSLANIIDGSSISLPMPNLPGAGIMLTGPSHSDSHILDLGQRVQTAMQHA